MEEQTFKVLYAKAGVKKRKLFADGTLKTKDAGPSGRISILYDESGAQICKITEKSKAQYQCGSEITFGAFVVQLDEDISADAGDNTVQAFAPGAQSVPVKSGFSIGSSSGALPRKVFKTPTTLRPMTAQSETKCDPFWDQLEDSESSLAANATKPNQTATSIALSGAQVLAEPRVIFPPSSSSGSNRALFSKPAVPTTVEQDPSLIRVMRPHQVVGADFLISRLLGQQVTSEDSEGEDEYEAPSIVTGAILADEMGVGKTLTCISALWAFVRRGSCKCLVVCPSSLVDNWVKEIKQWLGTRLKPLALRPGADAAALINTFAISMASLYPLLVLSYEMFRKHAALLNTVPNLEVMVCDEGHRLKNVGGTKTMEALEACKARRRVILSGTPIQNDLDELYAVVSFVVPGFLGSLGEYQRRFAQPISRGNEESASLKAKEAGAAAAERLRGLLGKIMLRRTQADILSTLLPARHDYVVYCTPTVQQAQHYEAVAEQVLRSVGLRGNEEDSGSEAEEVRGSAAVSTEVLSGLQKLRGICNSCAKQESFVGGAGGKAGNSFASAWRLHQQKENMSSATVNQVVGVGSVKSDGGQRASGNSAKLQFLMRFLTVLRRLSPTEKVVVVSNFTSTLDEVETAVGGRWGECLRLDGKVPVDQRQALVNRFNKADDRSFLFLLSAKAGGVGINLIGASRLIMYDVDWNPAVDHQAMSRIWREGQRREVHIYRLVMSDTIEEAILQRQRTKTDLAGMVEGREDALGDLGEGGGGGGREVRMSLTASDVLQLVYPNRHTARTTVGGATADEHVPEALRSGAGGGGRAAATANCPVLAAVVDELGKHVVNDVRLVTH